MTGKCQDIGITDHRAARSPATLAPIGDAADRDVSIITFETYSQPAPTARETWTRHPLSRVDALLAATIFIAALAARAPFIAKGETLLHSDEAIVGLMAQDIADGHHFPIYFYGQRYMGALEAYVIAAISPLFSNPIHALRAGPALFLAAMAAAQFLMLTRWFSRRGGLIGAAALISCSPMFMQWSISARGAYIEILLWGTLLTWAYSEWYVGEARQHARKLHGRGAIFGLLIGSGLWLNPAIVVFIVPIVLHALFNRPLAAARSHAQSGPMIDLLSNWLGRATLPVVALTAVLLLNLTWSVWVADHKVHSALLLGLLPKPAAIGVIALAGAGALAWIHRRTRLIPICRELAMRHSAMLLGVVVGMGPALLYTLQAAIGSRAMDPSLPLGFRPLWMAGDTLFYFLRGLPLLFGADARPFLQLVGVGRDTVTAPLSVMDSALTVAASWLAIGCIASLAMIVIHHYRAALGRLLRLEATHYPAAVFLILAVATTSGLYVLGGCTLDFTTIRYLVPAWVFVPGLIAAAFVSERFKHAAKTVPIVLCAAWAVGQWTMHQQLGAPHPLRPVADRLVALNADPVVAEPLDAHLLSYLTQQQCRTIEFESFWPRLGKYHPTMPREGPTAYLVQTAEVDRTWDWIKGGWPGETPPETKRFLWPKLRRAMHEHPERVQYRTPLPGGYELIQMDRPLNDRTIFKRPHAGR